MGYMIVGLWGLGWIIAVAVLRVRAGVGLWHRLRVFGPTGFGLAWNTTIAFCAFFWPITLVVWLARGCPEPRVVFNERALEREARLRAAA